MGSKLHSMTAFGRSSFRNEDSGYTLEIRSANSRFLDLRIRTPWALPELESTIATTVREKILRGRVEVAIRLGASMGTKAGSPGAHLIRRFQESKDLCEELKSELGLPGEVTLDHLFTCLKTLAPDSLQDVDLVSLMRALQPSLDEAMEAMIGMRKKEGSAMNRALGESLDAMTVLTDSISSLAGRVPQTLKNKLEERVAKLLSDSSPVDPVRLAQEAAILADKADITEELARIESHIDQIRATRGADPPHGRKLEFLLQEIQREVNTAGSKTPDIRIARAVVELKTELEKMREIAQNVE